MSELKLVVENAADGAESKPDVSSLNPFDALNRRDIELIKRSLNTMHKDCAELRNTMIALYQRNGRVPSKAFFLSLGVLWFVGVGILAVARPQLDAAMNQVPVFGKVSAANASTAP